MNYSGKENIFLYGATMGYSRKFIEEKYDEIVEFSELGDFIDVIHQTHGIAECIGIYILHQEALGLTFGQHEVYLICTMNVAAFDHFIAEIFIFNFKQSADFQQLIIKIHSKTPMPKWPFFYNIP